VKTLKQLKTDHEELAALMRQIADHLALTYPVPAATLAPLRREFGHKLLTHLGAEDWLLYPKLLTSKVPEVATAARQAVDELGGVIDLFRSHNERWNAGTIEQDWQGYCRDTRALMEAVTVRLEFENVVLFPLVAEAGLAREE
jgi:hypothetical protein